MNKYPFVKCLDPQKIVNPHTQEPLIVPCGKCEACRLQQSSMRALKCKLESLSHKYTMFVTLTYSNDNVPLMRPYLINEPMNKIRRKRRFYFVDMCERNKSVGEVFGEHNLMFSDLDKIRKKTNLGDDLPYLNKFDLQKFIKRVRKNLTKYSDEKIRYYAVGELGPVHYRPHYHLLLWFSDRQTFENIHKVIHQSWSFGRIDIQVSQGQSASYVAGYLNGSCNLPRIFTFSKTKPFACHSQFLGEKILQGEKEEVYKMSAEQFVKRSICFDGSNSEFSLWRTFKTTFYPRCPRFATLTHKQRLTSYLTYAAASEVCRKITPFQQAYEIVDGIISGKTWLSRNIIDYFEKTYNIHPFLGQTDYERKVRQVYMELRTSQHFLKFVCDGIDDLRHQDTMLRMIEQFYSDCEKLNLSEQLTDIDEWIKYDGLEIEDLTFMYNNLPFDSEQFVQNIHYKQFKELTLKKSADSVKHKTLNDKNKIFENI